MGLCLCMSLKKLSVAWVIFNLFISVNNEPFALGRIPIFSSLVEGNLLTNNFQVLLLSVFISFEQK